MIHKEKFRWMILCMVIAGSAVVFSVFSVITGKACAFYQGFAVDGDGNLYIGKTQVIEVLKPNGDVLRRIDPCTSRGYRFTMDADQTLWILDRHRQVFIPDGSVRRADRKQRDPRRRIERVGAV